ncbi:MAG: hypothetical protein JWR08_64, partial [Enterovirga sp.]|nr:hypothetical protein [Enterovirga sp.]
ARPGVKAGPARAVCAALSPLVLGRWVPDREACTNPDGTEFLPLVIGATKATAGDAACRFGARTRRGATWNLVAECTDGSNAWSSKVHLAVAQGRLTWSSEKGVQTYIRCDEDVRVATKRPAKTRAAARSAPKQARPAPVTKPTMRITADDGSVKTWALLKPR